jgi:hypothetical protein
MSPCWGILPSWRATDSQQGCDMRSFEVEARPVEPIPQLRVGMSVLGDSARCVRGGAGVWSGGGSGAIPGCGRWWVDPAAVAALGGGPV